MTRAKSLDRNRIRLGVRRVLSWCVLTSEISEHSRCGKADKIDGALSDFSVGAFRSRSRATSISQRHRISVAPREMSERVGKFAPLRNVREVSRLVDRVGARAGIP